MARFPREPLSSPEVGPVALSQKHRSVLYDHFAPLVGDEAAEALMAEFPAREGDELVTRQFLRAELADLRADLHSELAGFRAELADLRSDLVFRFTGTLLGALALATTVIIAVD